MSLYGNEKVKNYRIFSPRIENSNRKLDLNNKNNIGTFNEYSKFSNFANYNPINLYYSPKNISSPKNSNSKTQKFFPHYIEN